MPFTDSYKNTLLNDIFSGKYLGLGTSANGGEPTIDTEASSTGYERRAATAGAFAKQGTWMTNTSKIRFDEALNSGGWGTIAYLQVHESSNNANPSRYSQTFYIQLNEAKMVSQDYMPIFSAYSISVGISSSSTT